METTFKVLTSIFLFLIIPILVIDGFIFLSIGNPNFLPSIWEAHKHELLPMLENQNVHVNENDIALAIEDISNMLCYAFGTKNKLELKIFNDFIKAEEFSQSFNTIKQIHLFSRIIVLLFWPLLIITVIITILPFVLSKHKKSWAKFFGWNYTILGALGLIFTFLLNPILGMMIKNAGKTPEELIPFLNAIISGIVKALIIANGIVIIVGVSFIIISFFIRRGETNGKEA